MDLPLCALRISRTLLDSFKLRNKVFEEKWLAYASHLPQCFDDNEKKYIRGYVEAWFTRMCYHDFTFEEQTEYSEYILTNRFPKFTVNVTLTILPL